MNEENQQIEETIAFERAEAKYEYEMECIALSKVNKIHRIGNTVLILLLAFVLTYFIAFKKQEPIPIQECEDRLYIMITGESYEPKIK